MEDVFFHFQEVPKPFAGSYQIFVYRDVSRRIPHTEVDGIRASFHPSGAQNTTFYIKLAKMHNRTAENLAGPLGLLDRVDLVDLN